jgi:hypothetical protein
MLRVRVDGIAREIFLQNSSISMRSRQNKIENRVYYLQRFRDDDTRSDLKIYHCTFEKHLRCYWCIFVTETYNRMRSICSFFERTRFRTVQHRMFFSSDFQAIFKHTKDRVHLTRQRRYHAVPVIRMAWLPVSSARRRKHFRGCRNFAVGRSREKRVTGTVRGNVKQPIRHACGAGSTCV